MSQKWTEQQTLKFVRLYVANECLWDINCEAYRQKNVRSLACQLIIEEMNIEGFGRVGLSQKIKNIRSTYAQEVKKIIKSKRSGNKVYKPNVKWFNTLHHALKKVSKIVPLAKAKLQLTLDEEEEEKLSSDCSEMETLTGFSDSLLSPPLPSSPSVPSLTITSMPSLIITSKPNLSITSLPNLGISTVPNFTITSMQSLTSPSMLDSPMMSTSTQSETKTSMSTSLMPLTSTLPATSVQLPSVVSIQTIPTVTQSSASIQSPSILSMQTLPSKLALPIFKSALPSTSMPTSYTTSIPQSFPSSATTPPPLTHSISTSSNRPTRSYIQNRRRKYQSAKEVLIQVKAIVDSINSSSEESEFDIFGRHIASQLRKLPITAALITQKYIHTYLNQLRLQEIARCTATTSGMATSASNVNGNKVSTDFNQRKNNQPIIYLRCHSGNAKTS